MCIGYDNQSKGCIGYAETPASNNVKEMVNHACSTFPYEDLPNVVSEFKKGIIFRIQEAKDKNISHRDQLIKQVDELQHIIGNIDDAIKNINAV